MLSKALPLFPVLHRQKGLGRDEANISYAILSAHNLELCKPQPVAI